MPLRAATSTVAEFGDPTLVIENATVITMDTERRELSNSTIVIAGRRITNVIDGPLNAGDFQEADRVDATGCVLTPGLVNTHHHLYQWITRGLAADHTLFQWLSKLYPVWAGIDEESVRVAATAGLAQLAMSGCTTSTDHHYLFPSGGGDLMGAEITAATDVGLRFHPTRGSMDLGEKDGGLPPDSVVQSIDEILAASAAAIDTWHDPSPEAMLRIAVAPCSPFSVTTDLLRESAALARSHDVRMHTHLAESVDETIYCDNRFGCRPMQYMEQVDWLGPDVWFAHGIHFNDAEIDTLSRTQTGIAHCPTSNGRLGAGIARTRDLITAGVPVGLGVDGAASNEACGLLNEAHQAVLMARAVNGPTALTTRAALELATRSGARLLGRADDIGSIEPGKLADLALWRLDTLGHSGIDDPVAALVLGQTPPLAGLWVNGRRVIADSNVLTVDTDTVAAEVEVAHRTLMAKAY